MTATLDAIAPDVRRFAEREGLLDALERSFDLVPAHFPDAWRGVAEVVRDPDAHDQWITLNVDVPAEAPDLEARDDALVADWNRAIGWPAARGLAIVIYPVSPDGPA